MGCSLNFIFMSTQYRNRKDVPTDAICKRLDELATAVTKGEAEVRRHFVMRIPCELDYDPDIVLSEASNRLERAEKLIAQIAESYVVPTEGVGRMWRQWCWEYFDSANTKISRREAAPQPEEGAK